MNKWLKILLIILFFVIISVVLFIILKFLGITDIQNLKSIILSNKKLSILIYFTVLTLALILLCFVPLLNTSLVFLGIALFGPIIAFIICLTANFVSTSVLFFIGDKFGEKLAVKFIGKKDLSNIQDIVDSKSKILLPMFFIIPGLPDEGLILVAGMTKLKYWYILLVSIIYHSIETALFCFLGSGLIDWANLSAFDWLIFVNLIIVDTVELLKLEKHIKKK